VSAGRSRGLRVVRAATAPAGAAPDVDLRAPASTGASGDERADGARLTSTVAATIRTAVRLAGGREVCFVATVDDAGGLTAARAVARGDVRGVLALPGFARRGEMLVHNHPSGVLDPSEADLEVAAHLHEEGVGFAIVDNGATQLYVVVEVPRAAAVVPVPPEMMEHDLGPDGAIAASHPRYEDRPDQRRMARTIARLYNDGGIGVLEAGTGIGKSLAYLLPALKWAAANRERTVVSTNTINLQEQLVGIDLPLLRDAFPADNVRFALLKGWHNYLCLLRLDQARASGSSLFDSPMESELESLAAWAAKSRDGSRGELPVQPRSDVWDEVAAEPDLCQRFSCAHFDACFVFRARRAAADADVVVVNHHLLLSDLAVRRAQQNWTDAAVLPAYQRLIIDEGHHLEDAAASHLGASISAPGFQRLLSRLERRGRGLLRVLMDRLESRNDLMSAASLDLVRERLLPSTTAARQKGALLFDLLATLPRDTSEVTVRLSDAFADHPIWRAGLSVALTDVLREVELLRDGLGMVRDRLEAAASDEEALKSVLGEVRGVIRRLEGASDALRRTLTPAPDAPATIRWVEVRGPDRVASVTCVPLDLAPILRDDLFRRVTTAIVTSATLAPEGRFEFLNARLGLTESDVEPETAAFPSPFDFARHALIAIPSDIPAPNVDGPGHARGVVRVITDLAIASDGGMFALFTSHRDVREAAAALRAQGAAGRWPLLVHGEAGRDALLRRFRESGRAILLGTSSFWEGVDVPGHALRGIVITKLPFRVPTEPVTAAQCEAIEAKGGDPFSEYMVPHAALRLKQGVGRLIRTNTDRGAIILADPRLLTKSYGQTLMDSLPPARRISAPWATIVRELTTFYAEEAT
jgi:ATP-dependent DNA helicase DinG